MQMNICKIIYLNCGERYEDMIDHRSYRGSPIGLAGCGFGMGRTWQILDRICLLCGQNLSSGTLPSATPTFPVDKNFFAVIFEIELKTRGRKREFKFRVGAGFRVFRLGCEIGKGTERDTGFQFQCDFIIS